MLSSAPKKAKLVIDFCIVGGGVAGLSTAIALRRVGHRVLVLERCSNLDQHLGGCRMPPNLSKILYSWGLTDELLSVGVKSECVDNHIQETGEFIGQHLWLEEILKETRGEFFFGEMGKLRKMLHEVALSCGAQVRLSSHVVSIDPSDKSVKLSSGEVITADVVVGADGIDGLSRKILLEKNADSSYGHSHKLNLNMYCAMIPRQAMFEEPLLKEMYERKRVTLFTWFGNNHAVLAFKTGGPLSDFAIYIYGPRDGNEGGWENVTTAEGLQALLAPCEERLQILGKHARHPVCVGVYEDPPLEEWVTGRLVAVGAACHPMPPGSVQDQAMAIESGAVLAKIFSHLQSEDQIESFLVAFQDLRLPRLQSVHKTEVGILQYMTLMPCDFQQERDQTMRSKRDQGRSILEASDDEDESQYWVQIKEGQSECQLIAESDGSTVFGYDAEDAADDWWQQWGILREKAKGVRVEDSSFLNGILVAHQEC